jgi:RNA polymerase sigma-70 factor (sigma-E family)
MTTGENDAENTRDDERLVQAFGRIADQQTARYAGTYDLEAGLTRFTGWLHKHTATGAAPSQRSQSRFSRAEATRSSLAGDLAVALKTKAEEIEVAVEPMPDRLVTHADEAVTQLYSNHYRSLVRLAGLLVRDEPTAEEVVQECFIAMRDSWYRLREEDKALSYLKQAIVNRSRSVLRHRSVADRNASRAAPDMPGAGQGAMSLLERGAVISALRALPDRQRQALVLRYYADLSEAQIAEMMGISKGAVKSHTARGMSSLRAALERTA